MPTISEPIAPSFVPASWPPSLGNVQAHAEAVRLDLLDRGILTTRMAVLSYATDAGVPGTIAAQIADIIVSR